MIILEWEYKLIIINKLNNFVYDKRKMYIGCCVVNTFNKNLIDDNNIVEININNLINHVS